MRSNNRIKIILFSTVCSIAFSLFSLTIDEVIRPQRDMLIFNLKALVYIIVLSIAAISGIVVSAVVLISRSEIVSILSAAVVGITTSMGTVKGAYEVYFRPDYFDAPMFYADVVQIALQILMYPLICLIIWMVFRKDLLESH